MAKSKSNIWKWLLLLVGGGVCLYAYKKQQQNNTTTTTTATAELIETEPAPTPAPGIEQTSTAATVEENTVAEDQPITINQPSARYIVVSQWVDDFVNSINNAESKDVKIKILRRLGNREDVELFKQIIIDNYAMTIKDLFAYLDDDELRQIIKFFGGSEPTIWLFEGINIPAVVQTRVQTSTYTSGTPDTDDSNKYKGRSGNTSNTTTSSRSSRSSSSTNSIKSKILNADQLKLLII